MENLTKFKQYLQAKKGKLITQYVFVLIVYMKRQIIYYDDCIPLNKIVRSYERVHVDAESSTKVILYTWSIAVILPNSSGVYNADATAKHLLDYSRVTGIAPKQKKCKGITVEDSVAAAR